MIKETSTELPVGEEALKYLFEHVYSYMYNYAHKLLRDRMAAEDAVQEAFFRIIQRKKPWESLTHARNACLQAVSHVCLDSKRERNIDYAEWKDSHDGILDGDGDGLQKLLRLEVYGQVIKAVEDLPPARRDVIKLAYFEDRPLEEVAEMMGKSYTATKNLKYEAKQELRKLLLNRYHLRPELLQLVWIFFF
jgi:RNA polymerase sigma-70 factor (ECF subfamily)